MKTLLVRQTANGPAIRWGKPAPSSMTASCLGHRGRAGVRASRRPGRRPHPLVGGVTRDTQEVSLGRCAIVLANGYARLRLPGGQAVRAAREGALAVHGQEKTASLFAAYAVTNSDVTIHCLSADGFSGPASIEISDFSEYRSYAQDTASGIQGCLDPSWHGSPAEAARDGLRTGSGVPAEHHRPAGP